MSAIRPLFRPNIQSLEHRRCLAAAAHVMDPSPLPPVEEKNETATITDVTSVTNGSTRNQLPTDDADAFFTDLGRQN